MLYNPPHFRQTELAHLHAAIAAHGFATLVSNGPDGPVISHLPLLLEASTGPFGRLIGHVARANPHWTTADFSRPSVAIFHGPDAYVSPNWYPSKAETGKAVPTWNYSVIHATGTLKVFDDARWLRDAVTRLTNRHEAGRAEPWAVEDAPEAFIAAQLRGIIGIELTLTSLEGKAKLSQNRSDADRAGVMDGLEREADSGGAGVLARMRTTRPR